MPIPLAKLSLMCLLVIAFDAHLFEQPSVGRDGTMKNLDYFGDPVPPGVAQRLGTVRLRHGVVHAVAFSGNSAFLVSGGSSDNAVRVWDVKTGKEIAEFRTHESESDLVGTQVYAVAAHGDNDLVAGAAGTDDCRIHLFSLAASKRLAELRIPDMVGVKHLAFSADGKLLAAAGQANESFIWEVASRRVVRKLASGRGRGVAFTPDGALVIVASQGRQVQVFDVLSGKRVRTISFASDIESFALSPDGRTGACILSGKNAERRTISIFDVANGKKLRELTSAGDLYHVRFLFDGRTIGADGFFWDVESGRLVRRLECGVSVPAYSPDGRWVTFGLELRDLEAGKIKFDPQAHQFNVDIAGFLTDGRVVTGSTSEMVFKYWDSVSGKQLQSFALNPKLPASAFSADAKSLAGAFDTSFICFFDGTSGNERLRFSDKKKVAVEMMRYSPDGKMLAVGTRGSVADGTGGAILVIDSVSGKKIGVGLGHEDDVRAVVFHPAGKTLVSGSNDATIRVWDVATMRETARLVGHRNAITCLAVSSNGKKLASGSDDGSIRIWNLENEKEVFSIGGIEPSCVALSPDARFLAWASSTNDASVRIVEVSTKKEHASLGGHRGTVKCLSFSHDGKTLISGSEDSTALIWDLSRLK